MFFLFISLGGIYWYQVPKCIFSEILRKKIEKSWGRKVFDRLNPPSLRYNENSGPLVVKGPMKSSL